VPSVTSSVSNLQAVGPLLEVRLAVSHAAEQALIAAGSPVPKPIVIPMLIDTGASHSLIQSGLAQQLGLNPVSTVAIATPSSQNVMCDVYAVRLILPPNIQAELTAVEAPLQGENIQGLIGRDVLSQAVLVYIGYQNQFTLSF
jgi:predicted aspartyl protease